MKDPVMTLKIACWSGPRNLSTAMMYSFGARRDCRVVDEPFYAAYLQATGLDHPMGDDIIAAGETNADVVAHQCATDTDTPVFYQKHMTHHMIDGFDRDWFKAVKHVFLIRHPARVLASYAVKRDQPELGDIGFQQQAEIYDAVLAAGHDPVVIDSYDIRQNPEWFLTALCEKLGLAFDPAMLSWPKGGHPQDGVWAAHWYDAVHNSTGFAGPEGDLPAIDGPLSDVLEAAMPYYTRLQAQALRKPSDQ